MAIENPKKMGKHWMANLPTAGEGVEIIESGVEDFAEKIASSL